MYSMQQFSCGHINIYTLNYHCEDILSHLHKFKVCGTKPGFEIMLDILGLCIGVCFGYNSPRLSASSLPEHLYVHFEQGKWLLHSVVPLWMSPTHQQQMWL